MEKMLKMSILGAYGAIIWCAWNLGYNRGMIKAYDKCTEALEESYEKAKKETEEIRKKYDL